MAWDNTGSLTAIGSTGNGTIRYTYLPDGQRRTNTVNGKTTTYRYNNGMLLSEQTGDETLRYYYDATGKVTAIAYKKGNNAEVSYFYARNLQGDISALYRSSDSKLIGTYEYDLWGRPVSVTEATKGIDTDGILTKNLFRYRGHYYDPETGFYNLNARYYDPETGFYNLNARYYDPEIRRFISPDDIAYLGADRTLTGYNLYAYCGNNPANRNDPSGHVSIDLKTMFAKATANLVTNMYSACYYATKWHFEDREERNGLHPSYVEVNAQKDVWRLLPADLSIYHDNGIGKPELKYITDDGKEAVFDGDTLLPITDPRYIATYNYVPLYELPSSGAGIADYAQLVGTGIGHFAFDMLPYYQTGNSNTVSA